MESKKIITTCVLVLNKILFDAVLELEDAEEDFDEDVELVVVNKVKNQLSPRQREIPRCKNYFEHVIPQYLPEEFQSHFRISREAFELLCNQLIPLLQKNYHTGRPLKQLDKQILATIWILATPDSYRSIGTQFNMGKSTLSDAFVRVIKGLNQLASRVIKWPVVANRQQIINHFKGFGELNNVIGAIDGTYIPIKAPQQNPDAYITRKCFCALTLQAIVEPSLKFVDAFVGYPGSVSDCRVFRNSPIYSDICENRAGFFEHGEYIIGDKSYPILEWCIPPYIQHRPLTAVQTYFNTVHATTRQVIERAFALLFGRFRRLKFLDMNRQDLIPATVLAACVLHNLCLNHDDLLIERYIQEGNEFVQENGDIPDVDVEIFHEVRDEGRTFRNNIAENLYARARRH